MKKALKKQAVSVAVVTCCFMAIAGSARTSSRVDISGGLDFEQWVSWQGLVAKEKMLQNVSPADSLPGTVVAASSRDNPNYYYHWVRDAALTMLTLEKLAGNDPKLWTHAIDFAGLTKRHQQSAAPAGLGEVKFYVTGGPFTGPWGRPQNDGPAIRALALINLANYWLAHGQEARVRAELYDNAYPSQAPLKADLEYVSHYWTHPDFDLWEEVQGEHFFTRLMQRRALIEGAKLARRLGDSGAASWYSWQGHLIGPQIIDHWNAEMGYFKSTVRRLAGIDYKQGLDASVVLGLLTAQRNDDDFLPITDSKLASTVESLIKVFSELYPINQKIAELAPAIGRYPEDRYDGYDTNRQGNPWFLITAAFAQYCFELAQAYYYSGEIQINAENAAFIARAMGLTRSELAPEFKEGKNVATAVIDRANNEEQFFQVIRGIKSLGESFLKRIYIHSHASGALSEQLSRYTGKMQGAENLTWSYANFIEAIMAKEKLLALEEVI